MRPHIVVWVDCARLNGSEQFVLAAEHFQKLARACIGDYTPHLVTCGCNWCEGSAFAFVSSSVSQFRVVLDSDTARHAALSRLTLFSILKRCRSSPSLKSVADSVMRSSCSTGGVNRHSIAKDGRQEAVNFPNSSASGTQQTFGIACFQGARVRPLS